MNAGTITGALPFVDTPRSVAAAAAPRTDLDAETSATVDRVLALRGVTLSFGGVTAVSNIDLAVARGEIRAIIGPNGAGKSSLINLISGIYRPDSGTIQLGGRTFTSVPAQQLAKLGVARTFQNLALFPGLNVLDNVATGLSSRPRAGLLGHILGLPPARRAQRQERAAAAEILAFFRLVEFAHRPVGTLAYGLQKRVELARALIAHPSLLLLDEPMAGMTAGEKQEMCGFVRAARDQLGTTVVLIEHDIGVVMALSDRITVLDHGSKIADGPPAEVRGDPAVIDAYLGVDHHEAGSLH